MVMTLVRSVCRVRDSTLRKALSATGSSASSASVAGAASDHVSRSMSVPSRSRARVSRPFDVHLVHTDDVGHGAERQPGAEVQHDHLALAERQRAQGRQGVVDPAVRGVAGLVGLEQLVDVDLAVTLDLDAGQHRDRTPRSPQRALLRPLAGTREQPHPPGELVTGKPGQPADDGDPALARLVIGIVVPDDPQVADHGRVGITPEPGEGILFAGLGGAQRAREVFTQHVSSIAAQEGRSPHPFGPSRRSEIGQTWGAAPR